MTKKCPICDAEFIPNHYNQKYCSKECRTQGTKNRKKRWLDNNPDKVKLMREKRKTVYRETVRRCNREYYFRHRKKCLEREREYYLSHKEERREYNLEYYEKIKEKRMEIQKCALEHNNCFECPTLDGDCLYE